MNEHTQNTQGLDLINILLADGLENSIPKICELLMNSAMLLVCIQQLGGAPNQRNEKGGQEGPGLLH